jgi:hypothetical protein
MLHVAFYKGGFMLRLLIVLAVIAAALIRGGSLRNLTDLRMRHMSLVLAAFLLQLLIFPPVGAAIIPIATAPIYLLSLILLAIWVILNRQLPGIVLIGLGVVMNLAAIAANGGYMPVDPAAAAYAGNLARYVGESDSIVNNSIATTDVRLWILTDIFPMPAGVPFAKVYSLGDILLTTGISVLCYSTLRGRLRRPAAQGKIDEQPVPAT